eukprot:441367-Pelagomonas_calceolata.AAC.2
MVEVVTHDGCILEKPESEEEARRWLQGYGRTPPGTVGSIVITNLGTGAKFQVSKRVDFWPALSAVAVLF